VVTFILINPSHSLSDGTTLQLPQFCDELIVFDTNAQWVARQSEARWANGCKDRIFLKHLPKKHFTSNLAEAISVIGANRTKVVVYTKWSDLQDSPLRIQNLSNFEIRDVEETKHFEYAPNRSRDTQAPDLAILLIHIDNYELTHNCLLSLANTSFNSRQVYVLENASQNFSALRLFIENKSLIMIFATARSSYCSSFNILADFAIRDGAKYLFVSNNDTRNHSENIFETLISKLSGSIVMASPSIFDFERNLLRSDTVTHFGVAFNLATEAYVTPSAHWTGVGGFTTDFNIYCEDVDLLMRTNRLGLDGCYADNVSLEHLQNGATRKKVFLRTYFYMRNVIWIQKNKASSRIKNIVYFGLQEALAMTLWAIRQAKNRDFYPLLVAPWFLFAGLLVGVATSPRKNSNSQLVRTLKRSKWELKYRIR